VKGKGKERKSLKGGKHREEDKGKEEDQVKPSRPISSYILFASDNCKRLVEEKKIKYTAAMAECGSLWATIKEAEK